MRIQWILAPALGLALCNGLAADEAAQTVPPATDTALVYLDARGAFSDTLQTAPDRLRYLGAPAACSRAGACNAADTAIRLDQAAVEREYIDALNLGTYGQMNVKFTGKRVKLKVRF